MVVEYTNQDGELHRNKCDRIEIEITDEWYGIVDLIFIVDGEQVAREQAHRVISISDS